MIDKLKALREALTELEQAITPNVMNIVIDYVTNFEKAPFSVIESEDYYIPVTTNADIVVTNISKIDTKLVINLPVGYRVELQLAEAYLDLMLLPTYLVGQKIRLEFDLANISKEKEYTIPSGSVLFYLYFVPINKVSLQIGEVGS